MNLRSKGINREFLDNITSHDVDQRVENYNYEFEELETPNDTLVISKIEKLTKPLNFEVLSNKYSFSYKNYLDTMTGMIQDQSDCLEIKNIHHMVRPLGNISTSCNKILEVLLYCNIDISNDYLNIYCLAEGSASILWLLMRLFPNSKGFYNTLIDSETDIRYSPIQTYPLAVVQDHKIDQDRLNYEFKLSSGETDITQVKFIEKFIKSINKYPPCIFTVDAENKYSDDNMKFVTLYLPILVRVKCKLIIFKVFFNSDFDDQIEVLS